MAKRTCSIEGCEDPARGRGWCNRHLLRWQRHGHPLAGGPSLARQEPVCSVDDCHGRTLARGYCSSHYRRWRKYGDALAAAPLRPLAERFWPKVDRDGPNGCWSWLGARDQKGYGQIQRGGRGGGRVRAHQVAYELVVGPVPDGLQLDHLCRNPNCVNPAHLEPVTGRENVLRGRTIVAAKAAQTHCHRGHELTEANIYRPPKRPNSRHCRQCIRERP